MKALPVLPDDRWLAQARSLFRRYLAIEKLHNAGRGVAAYREDELCQDVQAWMARTAPQKPARPPRAKSRARK